MLTELKVGPITLALVVNIAMKFLQMKTLQVLALKLSLY